MSRKDLRFLQTRGISPEAVMKQMEIFRKGTPYLKLSRPCTPGDGIQTVTGTQRNELESLFQEYALSHGITVFVPASGAASRMFKILTKLNNENDLINRDFLMNQSQKGDAKSTYLLEFVEGVRRFAFFEDLRDTLAQDNLDIDLLLEKGQYKDLLDYLLTEKGLGYSNLPKGLLKFHRYSDMARDPLEEHLAEAALYARCRGDNCRIHFTVSPEHEKKFIARFLEIRSYYERTFGVRYDVDFSLQKKSTDTIAVDLENKPFRDGEGNIVLRPGGHGALIENLNDLDGDIVFIKNIDNVVPDSLKEEPLHWKKILAGLLIKAQKKLFNFLEGLDRHPGSEALIQEAFQFARGELLATHPPDSQFGSIGQKRKYITGLLNRPLRVCGMVRNQGEPGGGPFWVESGEGLQSLQIVESVQVDPESEGQQEILGSSTHFNPVDLVCGTKDYKGRPFDLKKFVDSEAVFISTKSMDGRAIKALELPGLWNGGMAYWNTLFVDVPVTTFNPVKTVNDLLRKEHSQYM